MSKTELICSDCIEHMKKMKENSVDLVITSPPYNVRLGDLKNRTNPQNLVQSGYDTYDDNMSHDEYILWLKDVFKNVYRVLKSGGRVCINIGDMGNGRVLTHSHICHFMEKELGYIPFSLIMWNKNQVTNRCSWGSFSSPSCPSFPCPFEYILIFAKEDRKIQYKGETDITAEEFKNWAYGMWNITPASAKKLGHPATFPEELPRRLIKMLSWKDALVFDPFMGIGTTGLVCKKLDRNFIGTDVSQKYCEMAQNRIDGVEDPIDFEKLGV